MAALTLVTGDAVITRLSLGASSSCALASPGSLLCWGDLQFGATGRGGQLDAGTAIGVHPTRVGSESDWTDVTVGGPVCGIRSQGVYCRGGNFYGVLGLGDDTDRFNAEQIEGLAANDVTLGGHSGCAIDTSGRLVCWGANHHGQLGNGSRTSSSVPTPVHWEGPDDWTRVEAGFISACATRADGSLYCWGGFERTRGEIFSLPSDVLVPTPVCAPR